MKIKLEIRISSQMKYIFIPGTPVNRNANIRTNPAIHVKLILTSSTIFMCLAILPFLKNLPSRANRKKKGGTPKAAQITSLAGVSINQSKYGK